MRLSRSRYLVQFLELNQQWICLFSDSFRLFHGSQELFKQDSGSVGKGVATNHDGILPALSDLIKLVMVLVVQAHVHLHFEAELAHAVCGVVFVLGRSSVFFNVIKYLFGEGGHVSELGLNSVFQLVELF